LEPYVTERLSAQAEAALVELSEGTATEQPLMVGTDTRAELEKHGLISATSHGGFLITEKGLAYVQKMKNRFPISS
jgi:hypothetical protein